MSVYVVIDPGHGGKDPGAIGFKINEKDVVLNLAKKLNDHLGQYEKAVVSLTRWDDRFLELSERAKFANDRNADLFISLHNNAASASAHGFESFIYVNASTTTARYQTILHEQVMNYLAQVGIHDRGKKRANYAVLRETKMPAILLENLFITNEKENKLLKDDAFLDNLAAAIAAGIAKIFGLKKKNTAPKPMYRIAVDEEVIYDTAYESKITDAVLEAVRKGSKEIQLKKL
ncbi:N-acetylmuramoyl-L-alanine amidase family protein [Thermoactinomyces vulgaris]|jgi:N-acetylmuramoyl-L-alanine amidase|uniref:N-acetylmuramoyl-L-alanine amidase family protein n=1 Tax=Thermoactinomyces vulgaris TaxID=2026 RepID=UPI00110771A7|nr:N-acetylmuramoyl-L-alanine amidase [Thermoactinomyces vulgaris]QCV56250.1 N-acetylmuramoyl-L-alanine amidase [Thermoactinomyces vulgaris]